MVSGQKTQELLRQIVSRLTSNLTLREDLIQEASLHLWLRQKQRPGQTRSWYLQSCRFFLQNHLRNGRSLDSAKRAAGGCSVGEFEESGHQGVQRLQNADSIMQTVSAREILTALAKWLTPIERQVLQNLSEGWGVREISSHLKISHTSVIRHRRKIASLALSLGIEPVPKATTPKKLCSGVPTRPQDYL